MLQVVGVAAVGRASARSGATAVSTKARQRRKKFFCRSDLFTLILYLNYLIVPVVEINR